jgi:hypothetical protein
MPDWNTRLVVKRGDQVISPIENFTPTFNTPHTVMHSLEVDNVGYVRQPFTYSFTMSVRAVGSVVADLTELAVNGSQFDIAVAESKNGKDWAFKRIQFSGCIINSCNPSNVVIDGAPMATFTCMALNVTLEVQA